MSDKSPNTWSGFLATCIERENLSEKLYLDAMNRVEDPASKKILERMAREERKHAALLQRALETGRIDGLSASDHRPPTASPNTRASREITTKSRPADVFAYAIEKEERSIDYYQRYLDAFRGTEFAELFERLIREEENHRQQAERLFVQYGGEFK